MIEIKEIRKEYDMGRIDKIMGEINHQIWEFWRKYKEKPKFVLISEELLILFNYKMNLLYDKEIIMLDNEPLKIGRIYGTVVIVSRALKDYEFEVR